MREVVIPARAQVTYRKDIQAYTVTASEVTFAVGLVDEAGNFLPGQRYETISVRGADLQDLLAADPGTGKPAGVFRKDDLWPLYDRLKDQQPASIRARMTSGELSAQEASQFLDRLGPAGGGRNP